MSATMSGLDALSSWLDALLFMTNYRPVPLTEHAVFKGMVYVKQDMYAKSAGEKQTANTALAGAMCAEMPGLMLLLLCSSVLLNNTKLFS